MESGASNASERVRNVANAENGVIGGMMRKWREFWGSDTNDSSAVQSQHQRDIDSMLHDEDERRQRQQSTLSISLRAKLQKDLFRFIHHDSSSAGAFSSDAAVKYRKVLSLIRTAFLIGRLDRFRERYLDGILWILYHFVTEYLFAQSLGEFLFFSVVGGIPFSKEGRQAFIQRDLLGRGRRVRTQKGGGSYDHQRKVKLLMKVLEAILVNWGVNFLYEMGVVKSIARLVIRSKSSVERLLLSSSVDDSSEELEPLRRRDFQFESDASYQDRQRQWLDSFIAFMGQELMLAHKELSAQQSTYAQKLPSAPPLDSPNVDSTESIPTQNSNTPESIFNQAMHTLLQIQKWSELNASKNAHAMDVVMQDLQPFQRFVQQRNLEQLTLCCRVLRDKYQAGFTLPSLGLLPYWNPGTVFVGALMNGGRHTVRFMMRYALSLLMFTLVHEKLFRWLYNKLETP